MAALAVVCIIIWCTVQNRWSGESWAVPLEYGSSPAGADVLAEMGGWKAAQDGYFSPGLFHYEPRLNAPFVANWNDIPVNEDLLIWGVGMMARIVGLHAAANLLVLLVQVLAALAFYYTARRLKCDWRWAAGAALLFALAPYAFAHSLHHVDITNYWHIPLCLLVCFWTANGRGIRFKSRDYWLAIAVAVITGLQNIYYINVFLQLLGISLITQWMRRGWSEWRVSLVPLSIGATAAGSALVLLLRVPLYALLHGRNAMAVSRTYSQMEYYGLKLIDMFIPFPTHKIPFFASLGRRYYLSTILPAEIPPACYLGVMGMAAFLWLGIYTVRNAIKRNPQRMPLEAVQVLWVFFYAMVGGVNAFIGILNFQLFRSTTRFCIVIMAIVLLFAVRRLSLLTRRWPAPWPNLAPIAFAFVGVWEILPPSTSDMEIATTAATVASDRSFAQAMEAKLPSGGMVFQMPVMDFPESPAPGIGAYDHFRPYLYTNTLRYSYGTDKGRLQDNWQHVVGGMAPAAQVAALERYGFSAIYVNRAGYADHGEALLEGYKAAGRAQVIESRRGDLFCVLLKPEAHPELPPPGPFFGKGWYPEQDQPNGQRNHLAAGNAVLILTNTNSVPVDQYANFFVASAGQRTVEMKGCGAQERWRLDETHPAKVTNLRLTLQPGQNDVSFETDAAPVQQQIGAVTFDVVNFELTDKPVEQ